MRSATGTRRAGGVVLRLWLMAVLPGLLPSCAASLATRAAEKGGDAVTSWTLIADDYGDGSPNWRTLAVMHMAMHDSLNAARPRYARWSPPVADEPRGRGADPDVAMAAAAYEVLWLLHPQRRADTERALATILRRYPQDASTAAGLDLGKIVGRAAVERRAHDGFERVGLFQGNDQAGHWRPTPTSFESSSTNDIAPFLFTRVDEVGTLLPPPSLDSAEFHRQLAETARLGAKLSIDRTSEQTAKARFWAYQSSQRGFVELAVRLVAAHPPAGGIYDEARLMAQLSSGLADSAILTWHEKAAYAFWRPITAIRAMGGDPQWVPLIETPPFPEYPSGHATDCYVGAGILEAAFPNLREPIVYVSSAYLPSLDGRTFPSGQPQFTMGQHAQVNQMEVPGGRLLRSASLAALAEDCATSRIWAGAHFSAAAVESKRLAQIIVSRALGQARRHSTAGIDVTADPATGQATRSSPVIATFDRTR